MFTVNYAPRQRRQRSSVEHYPMLSMPVKTAADRVVTFGDVASVRRGFKDPEGFARVGGQPAVTLEIKKGVGANIIETIAAVREIVAQEREHWPASLQVMIQPHPGGWHARGRRDRRHRAGRSASRGRGRRSPTPSPPRWRRLADDCGRSFSRHSPRCSD
ncbi:efflux RND transporter permease subunit [Halochromatium roseum]|uniref:efflux RND transporter permease subunit n=1 Tax=Halochromatium roseum TaxID=391920 RepID=UPI00237BA097|nr:efflux RND transporter permease subunit [Halochromatium roseum]